MNTKTIHLETLACSCPCGSSKRYADCCNRYINLDELASTAEILMRSRYTAYTLNYENYLLATWHHDTRPTAIEVIDQLPKKWLGLVIKRHEQFTGNHAIIEFIARYKINGRAHRLHEISRFVREDGIWFYVDGDIL
ncbi:SEC-C motif-containing protein [Nitrosomonas ureae]|uniref:SEC-C motif-containing protein n=1 Tax=Nitrosomonas ureae TaxID=44577 RepID=A0A285C1A5_9PROT|nr:YchJ family metal-binding protein [Nitrosomonas ureae]SNX61377.1 SEC-C motif-containing protein [Nitrosomonas ureae]